MPTMISTRTGWQRTFRFFDVDLILQTDSTDFLRQFTQAFRRFQVADDPSDTGTLLSCSLLTSTGATQSQPVLLIDDQAWPIYQVPQWTGYVQQIILNAVATRIKSHYLIHAGVVSAANRGLMLAGNSFLGKTTLVLALMQCGFRFLSDETAALGRSDGRVYPFPRSFQIRPGSLPLTGLCPTETPNERNKILTDVEQLFPDKLGQAVPLTHIVVLHNSAESENRSSGAGYKVAILIDRITDPFLGALRQLRGLTDFAVGLKHNYPLLKFRTAHRHAALTQIDLLCREHDILLMDVVIRADTPPNFIGPAQLEPIPPSQAALELLSRFQGGYNSAIVQGLEGCSSRLYLDLAEMIGDAQCFSLETGPLATMVDLLCNLVNAPETV